MYTDLGGLTLIVCTGVFTLLAAFIDYRTNRIPNKLTLPAFLTGVFYQIAFHGFGWPGLLDGLAGFAIGFGMYFVLWVIGSGGGGDAKLAGAVAMWLGFYMTLGMIITSTVFVILGTGLVVVWGMLTKGVYRTKNKLLPSSDTSGKTKKQLEMLKINKGRMGMTFGLSVALATVAVTVFAVPDWPYRRTNRDGGQAGQKQLQTPNQDAAQPAAPNKTTDKPKTTEKKS